ncbi:hypothetical protein [Microbacterium aquimaris]|uniref:hypothetical protein n=1 Tax=Microbacterium aquimaris TaxID=459816 RepID=UPI003906ADE8
MAFPQVAGAMIAIVSSIALVIHRLVRRARWSTITIFTVIANLATFAARAGTCVGCWLWIRSHPRAA